MSLVATWCLCSNGKWYEDPVWEGDPLPDSSRSWFLCLDDDEPPELVVQIGQPIPEIPWFRPGTKMRQAGRRYFSETGSFNEQYRPARNQFGSLIRRPDPPQEYSSVSDTRPSYMGHYYELKS